MAGSGAGTRTDPQTTSVAADRPGPQGPVVEAGHHVGDHHHRDVSGGWLRPAVFGAMDGLVTNVSLIAGVGGSGAVRHTVVLTGLAGLVAGAFSMATGEWLSVSSQNESVLAEVRVEELELHRHPVAEAEEMAAAYVRRGVEPALAREVVAQLSADPVQALRLHAQEELGIDPDELPSPWTAALSSFACFAVGAVLPLLPYLLGAASLTATFVIAALALVAAGALTARFTGRPMAFSAARQLSLGVLAAAVTYLVGRLVGAGAVG